VAEHWYRAVLEVLSGTPVAEVAEPFGVATRGCTGGWLDQDGGLDGLTDGSHEPKTHPWRISAHVEAVICDLCIEELRVCWGTDRK
jgi:hypothetical protein